MSEVHKISGKIVFIGDLQTFDSGFTKREFRIEFKSGDYTNALQMAVLKDKCAMLDQFSVGDDVRIKYNPSSREHKERWYTECVAWNITKNEDAAPPENEPVDDVDPDLGF